MGYLQNLNDQQRRAVEHVAEPLLIIAGAGSGKTNTLAHRVAHRLKQGADPRRVLLMTFSRRAAAELTRRVSRITESVMGAGYAAEALTWAGTFHGIGARILRDLALQIGLSPDFTIHDREDSADLMNLCRHDAGLSKTEKRFPAKGTCLAIYSRTVNSGAPLAEVLRDHYPWCAMWEAELKRLFGSYAAAKQAQNVLDYDDLLLAWAKVMADPGFAAHVGAMWDHVLIDEYQDTNALQSRILLALKPSGQGLTVVGDDAQSIYAFRAATVRNILDFPAAFAPPAQVVTLNRNYRSTQPILAAANAVIAEARERFTKDLWTDRALGEKPRLVNLPNETDQARFVADQVLANRETGMTLKQQAVLFRTSSHSGQLEVELTRRNIPFVKFGGLKFLDTAHVKDLLAALRFAQNPKDRVAGFRVLQVLPGLGPSTAAKVLDRIATMPMAEVTVPPKVEGWPDLVAALAPTGWPEALGCLRAWYEPHLDRIHEDAEFRRADLLQLEQIAMTYPSRETFLTDITLDPPNATSAEAGVPLKDDDYLILSTIHSAKGQEWKAVFLLNAVDGCIPSDLGTGQTADIEEERRLLYVAMTRAKDQLTIGVPLRFFVIQQTKRGDRHMFAARTRFITRGMLERFDVSHWAPPIVGQTAAPALGKVDVAAGLRGMWG
ncbi:ATP-dependent helicase [Paracoccus sp. R12_1]|uniref:ATP-dependent helicase n=1 Tax=unclassified Paracoccus (in: a-proteobacteria) TaxID=2688777 RepID=UPI001ADC7DE0|nr:MULTISPECIES: ATP-dependent helicase [unclassified Paracoccus (in: a-proteobacteria)]MBO9454625.1 ATP-dependent helicase [Paracoccus sp. R12_2]MBO9486179.1 ATP-dependent helicase [Paracoccus sp. R12_1]